MQKSSFNVEDDNSDNSQMQPLWTDLILLRDNEHKVSVMADSDNVTVFV